tara:strand:+ start:134 stop:646 length:513 start_codon:yes stop_codon:yes gene_type:complete
MINKLKIVSALLTVPFLTSGPGNANNTHYSIKPRKVIEVPIEIETQQIEPITSDLIEALIQVESMGNDSAVGDTHLPEPSIGVLQLRPIMVREVNRILKKQKSKKRFKLKDRFSREKSIEMFMVWKNYHHPKGGFETIARNWNGGPRGYKNKRTEHYWAKVQLELNKKDI